MEGLSKAAPTLTIVNLYCPNSLLAKIFRSEKVILDASVFGCLTWNTLKGLHCIKCWIPTLWKPGPFKVSQFGHPKNWRTQYQLALLKLLVEPHNNTKPTEVRGPAQLVALHDGGHSSSMLSVTESVLELLPTFPKPPVVARCNVNIAWIFSDSSDFAGGTQEVLFHIAPEEYEYLGICISLSFVSLCGHPHFFQ